jgi:lipoprotein NlpI
MKLTIIALFTLLLLGCSVAGIPYTSDPMTKLEYGYQLMNIQGRGLAAEKLGLEALTDFEKSNDIYGIAEAYTYLGLYYKNKSYRERKAFYVKHNEYDPTATKSIKYFELAAKAFEKDDDYWGVSKVLFAMGNAYGTDKDNVNSCIKNKKSLIVYKNYKRDNNSFKGRGHSYNPAYKSYSNYSASLI